MPIDIQYTPVAGVAQLARRGGQQQQAVREQGFQFQQDLIGLQANLQQKRDVMLNQFQQTRDVQLQQYETAQQERKYQWLNYQARQDKKFQEEMVELQIEQYKDRQKFDVKLENEQYVAKRKFDFDMELQGLATENQFRMQLEQQKTMGDLAEQQMKAQQKERETEAAIKAIQENAYLSPEEQERAITAYQTKQTAMMKPTKNVAYSPEVLRESANTGKDPSHIQWAKDTLKQLPAELKAPYMAAFNNPALIPQFNKLYEAWWDSETQRLAGEYGLIPRQETPSQRRGRGVPKWRSGDAGLTKQWDYEMTPEQQDIELAQTKAYEGQMAGIEALGKQAVTDTAKEAERQEHLRAALEADNRATRNYHLREAGINPNDLDVAERLIKEHDKAWSRYNSAYKQWVQEDFETANIERLKGKEAERESRLRTRFTEAATDMSRIETQLKQLSEEFKKQTSPFPEYPNAYFENGSWYVMKNGQRYRIEE